MFWERAKAAMGASTFLGRIRSVVHVRRTLGKFRDGRFANRSGTVAGTAQARCLCVTEMPPVALVMGLLLEFDA